MKKTASIANIKPVIDAPAMAAATWLVPTPDDPTDEWDELPAVLALVSCDEDKLLDVRVPTAAPGAMDTSPGGDGAPGGLFFDETGTGTKTIDWFVGGEGDAEEGWELA